MRSSRTTGRATAWTAWAVLTALLAAGCATMPDSGEPARVPARSAGADSGVQVRVIPVPPRDGQLPRDVVQNFLDASIADEGDYRTAQAYLTDDAKKIWHPESHVVVVDSTNPGEQVPGADPLHATEISLSSSQIGELDAKHSFSAVQNTVYRADFTLVNEAKDSKDAAANPRWRIANLPSELIVDRTNFRNTYQQVDRYFFNAADPAVAGSGEQALVPDPFYVRRRIEPATAAARALVQEGASDWISPAVHSSFDGNRLVGSVNADDPKRPRVTIDGIDLSANRGQCQKMAAQLYFTLVSSGGVGGSIDAVSLASTKHGSCDLSSAQARSYTPGSLAGAGASFYRNFTTGQLMRRPGPDTAGAAVLGALGQSPLPAALTPTQARQAGPFAVSRDEKSAAVVSQDGRSLYVAGLADQAKLGTAVVTSAADQGLTSPSWDGLGGLWLVDRDPADPRVLLIRGQSRLTVSVDPLGARTVDGIRVSSDGTRAALLLKDASGARSLWLGRVVRSGSPAAPMVAISAVRPLAPQLSDVSSVSWADVDQLLVLGKASESVLQLHYVGMDGLQSTDSALQAVDGMTVVAASEDRTKQVLADSVNSKDTSHALYVADGNGPWQWRAMTKDGALPAYPG